MLDCLPRHLETVLASRLRNSPVLEYDRDLLQLPDGGTVALDFESVKQASAWLSMACFCGVALASLADLTLFVQDLPADAPVVILLPGLTGGSHDTCVFCLCSPPGASCSGQDLIVQPACPGIPENVRET